MSNNAWIQQNNDTISLSNMITHQSGYDNLSITMLNNTPYNTLVNGRLYVKYNNYTYSDTASFLVKNAVGINDFQQVNNIQISPNPNDGLFTVDFENTQKDVSIVVYDMFGKKIFSNNYSNKKSLQLDLSGNAKGVYLLEIMQGNNVSMLKVQRH